MSQNNWEDVLTAWLERLRLGSGWQLREPSFNLSNLPEGAEENILAAGPDERDMRLLLLGREEKTAGGRAANYPARQTVHKPAYQPAGKTAGGIWRENAREMLDVQEERDIRELAERLKREDGPKTAAKKRRFEPAESERSGGTPVIKRPVIEKLPQETGENGTPGNRMPGNKMPVREKLKRETLKQETPLGKARRGELLPEEILLEEILPERNLPDKIRQEEVLTGETPQGGLEENALTAAEVGFAGWTFNAADWPAEERQVENGEVFAARETRETPETRLNQLAAEMDVDGLADLVAEKLRNDIEAVLGSSSLV